MDDVLEHSVGEVNGVPGARLNFLWLEVTNRCNLQCKHCYAESGPHAPETEGLLVDDWLAILREASKLGCKGVQFIGGEPLLYRGLPVLLREARTLNFETIEVYSNATRLDSETIDLFTECGAMLATSFYSEDSCTHDAVTGVRGSQGKTIAAIRRALDAGIRTRVGVVSMPENEAGVDATISYLRGLGVQEVAVDHARGIGRGAKFACSPNPMEQLCGACGHGSLAINSAGEVAPCVFSHFRPIGHVADGLGRALDSQCLADFRDELGSLGKGDCMPQYGCPPRCNPQTQCRPAEM